MSTAQSSVPLVSVVVPFYNIEGCVGYCLDSLLNQSLDDYEVICVDDGSTDATSSLLDVYALQDDRVKAFHIENGGQGAARNYGVSKARGRYISFVDGDDCVSPRYLESLVAAMGGRSNRFVFSRLKRLLPSEADFRAVPWGVSENSRVIDRKNLRSLLYEDMITAPCARLAERALYVDHPFPVMNYEDVAVSAEHLLNCESFVVVNAEIYGYVQRQGSTVRGSDERIEKSFDYEQAIALQIRDLIKLFGECDAVVYKECLEYSRLFRLLSRTKGDPAQIVALREKAREAVRGNLRTVMKDRRVPRESKVRFWLLAHAPKTYLRAFDAFDVARDRKMRASSARIGDEFHVS